jgi:hypothetical protein
LSIQPHFLFHKISSASATFLLSFKQLTDIETKGEKSQKEWDKWSTKWMPKAETDAGRSASPSATLSMLFQQQQPFPAAVAVAAAGLPNGTADACQISGDFPISQSWPLLGPLSFAAGCKKSASQSSSPEVINQLFPCFVQLPKRITE